MIAPKLSLVALWVYCTLLLVGGLIGFLKAGSKVSLITSGLFAVLLALCATGVIHPFWISEVFLGLLVVVFGIRLRKTGKFMPSGMLLILSIAVLAVLLLDR